MKRDDAEDKCKSVGAKLATIKTKKDVKELQTILRNLPNGSSLWTGGLYNNSDTCKDKPNQSDCWYWDSTEDMKYDSDVIDFATSEQDPHPDESSGIILISGEPLLLYYDQKSSTHAFICEHDATIPVSIVKDLLSRLQN